MLSSRASGPGLAAMTKTFATWEWLGPFQVANAFVRANWPGPAALTKASATWEELGPLQVANAFVRASWWFDVSHKMNDFLLFLNNFN